MELPKHKNHRNLKYLAWVRSQDCVIAGRKADVAHHVNLGTNSGKGIKASDYFCIPLLNEFHTTGLWAVHGIGEESFLKTFKLNQFDLFVFYLSKFLKDYHKVSFDLADELCFLEKINILISKIDELTPEIKRISKKKIKSQVPPKLLEKYKNIPKVFTPKISETDYYQKSKELKKEYDKEMRLKNKKKLSEYRKEQYRKAKEFQKRNSMEMSSK